jgi:hypothetical protein
MVQSAFPDEREGPMKSHFALGLIVAICLACSHGQARAETDTVPASAAAAHPWEAA